MKINFKKIASVLAATVMLGSTVAFAAAAYPEPFVKSGVADAAIVVGAAASQDDMAAAIKLGADLDTSITSTTVVGTTSGTGNTKELSKDNVKINLGDALNSVYLTLDQDELSGVLADSIYEDEAGTEYDYEQKITLGTTTLTHFVNDEVNANEVPVIGFEIPSSTTVLSYTLDFTDNPSATATNLETTFLEMLGVKYYISDVTDTTTGLQLTLLDSANTATVDSSGPKTVTVGDKSYQVEIVSVDEGTTDATNKATLIVNGAKIDSTNQGNSRKIDTNTYLSVIDVSEASRESDLHYVEFSIGSGKLVIANGSSIELNDDTLQEVTSTISNVSGKLSQIKLDWAVDDESYLVPGMDLVLPGLKSIKLSMSEFTSPTMEEMSIANSGDDYMQLKDVKVKDGTITNLPILYLNTSLNGFAGLGKDATHTLLTSNGLVLNLNDSRDSYFVASRATTDDFESYVFELVSVNEVDSGVHNETKIKNLATGNEITITDADDKDFGDITLTTSAAHGDLGTVTITVSGTGVYTDRIYTAAGMGIRLPIINATGTTGSSAININATANANSFIMNLTEGDKDNNVDSSSYTVTLAPTSALKGPEVDVISPVELAIESSSDDYEGYVISSRATKMLYKTGGDQDTLEIMYPTTETYAKVYIAESAAVVGSSKDTIKIVKDSEVDSVKSKNLIVIGGSCINTVAATLLGKTAPVCGADFTTLTTVSKDHYLIETFNGLTAGSGKIAILIAGYEAADTTNAVKSVIADGADTTVGKKVVGPGLS